MHITFRYGLEQRFRFRYEDITIGGSAIAAQMPIRAASWRLNQGPRVPLFVDSVPDLLLRAGRDGSWFASPTDWRTGYKDSKAGLRLKDLGDFVVEIPVTSAELRKGTNRLTVEVEDHGKDVDRATMEFAWDPRPATLPIAIGDTGPAQSVQDVAQIVNGFFELDRDSGGLVTRAPAAPDSLALIAAPAGSQEATFSIRSAQPHKAKYIGLSDFFVRHEAEDPPIGVKPGWSTAGLATVRFDGEARSWLSFGDNSARKEGWVQFTDPPASYFIRPDVTYRVRHQVTFSNGSNASRFRLWPDGEAEPQAWLCEESDRQVARRLPRHVRASFGLFQHTGGPTVWSDIRVREL